MKNKKKETIEDALNILFEIDVDGLLAALVEYREKLESSDHKGEVKFSYKGKSHGKRKVDEINSLSRIAYFKDFIKRLGY